MTHVTHIYIIYQLYLEYILFFLQSFFNIVFYTVYYKCLVESRNRTMCTPLGVDNIVCPVNKAKTAHALCLVHSRDVR